MRSPAAAPFLIGLTACLVVVLIWTLATDPANDLFLPSPESVLAALFRQPSIWIDSAAATAGRAVGGLILGSSLGIAIGLVISANRRIAAVLYPLIEFIRPLPVIALIPLFIFWFGIGLFPQLLVVVIGTASAMLLTTVAAVRAVPPPYLRIAKVFGARPIDIYVSVVLPAILPATFGGLRVAAGLAFGLTVAAELIGAQTGLGYIINNARRVLQSDAILLGVILVGFESMTVDAGIRWLRNRTCNWADDGVDIVKNAGQ